MLRIIENKKFRKRLTNGPNYRELGRIKFSKAYFEIDPALDACIEKMSTKKTESVLTMVKEKI